MRSFYAKPIFAVVVIAAFAATAATAHATRMPVLTGVGGPLRVRPATFDLAADGSVVLGGFTGLRPTESSTGPVFGHLHWTAWDSTQGRAWGAEWINNCRPSCGAGYYSAYRATVHVYDPGRTGVFLSSYGRLFVKG